MPKAQKKPIVIDYFRVGEPWASIDSLKEWITSLGGNPEEVLDIHRWGDKNQFVDLKINTLEGSSYEVPQGYIIIRGIKGEYYPCDPVIFEQTYDLQ